MGSFSQPITLVGPAGEITLEALVDTGATHTWIPSDVLQRLGAAPARYPFVMADGRTVEYGVGQVLARIDGRQWLTLCIFGESGTEPLLGVVTLEEFGLGVDPVNKQLIPVSGRLKLAEVGGQTRSFVDRRVECSPFS